MIRIFALLLLPLAALLPPAARAEALPALYDVSGVAAGDVLNLRAGPSASAARLGTLASDAVGVEVTALSEDGRWGRVNMGEAAGWVAMRYLARQVGPDWDSLAAPLACSGTEPFWSAEYDPAAQTFTLRSPGDPVGRRLDILGHRSTAGRSGRIGVLLPEGFALLAAENCSDGMSDRAHGISISLFPTPGAAAEGLSGCCSLAR
ncbi:MAG: SH3 domain-containing protein [Gemmobacter sp.]|jgi:uncharacterized membrane protein|nr:SH3 domain-containing protein [Gemmobacter sp.]